jgi:hypothetical protein
MPLSGCGAVFAGRDSASPIGRGLPNLTSEASLVRKGEGFVPLRVGPNPSPHSPKLTFGSLRLMALSLWERR